MVSDRYLGTDFILTYPSVDNITDEVLKLGKGYKMFKVDISRAFCHVPIDPGDLDLLGLYWDKHTCTKRELQSLLGSLMYVAKCVNYARYFLIECLIY